MAYTIKRKRRKRVKIKKSKRRYKGGVIHDREDVAHYHLHVRKPGGGTIELPALFAKSSKARPNIKEINVTSATIGDLKTAIIDKEWSASWLMVPGTRNTKDFTLFWRGKALLDDKMKLREISDRLPLHKPNSDEPIIIKLNEDLEYPTVVETERSSYPGFEDTPPDE
jgi:hypothetical protein